MPGTPQRGLDTRFLGMALHMIDTDQLDQIMVQQLGARKIHQFFDLSEKCIGGEGDDPIAMIIGEAPGAQEDTKGRPFVGPAGVVLRDLMNSAGLYSEAWKTGVVGPSYQEPTVSPVGSYAPNCWLTNVVKFRPPRNRTPTQEEVNVFRQYLLQEWHAIGCPRVIIPVGGVALRAVYGKPYSILKMAGKVHYRESRTKPGTHLAIWPMVHPSYGLRSGDKRLQELMERDWDNLRVWFEEVYERERG